MNTIKGLHSGRLKKNSLRELAAGEKAYQKLFYFRRLNSVKLRLSYRLRLCEYSKG